jgi:peptide/nickel transport system substrate-binding protein
VLTVGADLSGNQCGPIYFDPEQFKVTTCYFLFDWPIYGGLLRLTPNGNLVPDLASSVSVANSTTISVQVRPGVTFSDGTPLDAASLKSGLERNISIPNKSAFNALLYDVSSIDVTGPDSVVIHLSKPVAGYFYRQLADEESFIVSPAAAAAGTLSTHPVGAGPFILKSVTPTQKIVLVKNPRYWDARDIKVSEVDFVNVAPGPQQVNAIESGLVNAEVNVPVADLPALRSNSSLNVTTTFIDGSFLWMPICKAAGPLANQAVRQALYYATNRSAINTAILQGKGEVVHGLWPSSSPLFDQNLASSYPYDPAKAKQLLAQAGYPNGFTTSVIPMPIPLADQAVQIIQSEWKQIGVRVSIMGTTNPVNDFDIRHLAPIAMFSQTRPGINKAAGPYLPGSLGNVCNYYNSTLTALVTQLEAVASDSPQANLLWQQIQQFVSNNALSIYLDWTPVVNVSTKPVQTLPTVGYVGPVIDYWDASVAK